MKVTLPFFLALGLAFTGCKDAGETAPEPEVAVPAADGDTQRYHVKGILQMKKGDNIAIIDHEEIPGYMAAMVMPFKVKEPTELEGLEPGAVLEFDYVVSDLSSWMENVEDTGETGELKIGKKQSALPE